MVTSFCLRDESPGACLAVRMLCLVWPGKRELNGFAPPPAMAGEAGQMFNNVVDFGLSSPTYGTFTLGVRTR
jgi:hypothetical protein